MRQIKPFLNHPHNADIHTQPNTQQFSPAVLNLRGIEGGGDLFVIFTICSVPLQIPLIYRIHPVYCFSLHFAHLRAGVGDNGGLNSSFLPQPQNGARYGIHAKVP